MPKDYKQITRDISGSLTKLRTEAPEMMRAFSDLASAATQNGVLDKKTKELIALALGVAARCDGCLGFHTQALAKLGASKQEVVETLGMAVYMGGGPSLMYAADAMSAFEQAQS
jgi:AhpD family alkylhydroperoxidase